MKRIFLLMLVFFCLANLHANNSVTTSTKENAEEKDLCATLQSIITQITDNNIANLKGTLATTTTSGSFTNTVWNSTVKLPNTVSGSVEEGTNIKTNKKTHYVYKAIIAENPALNSPDILTLSKEWKAKVKACFAVGYEDQSATMKQMLNVSIPTDKAEVLSLVNTTTGVTIDIYQRYNKEKTAARLLLVITHQLPMK